MKKSLKFMAVLSAAACMTALTPAMFTAQAQSTGWIEDSGNWRFYDAEGYYLTDAWKKHGNDWYYLNDDGNIALDELVDDEYYVGADGKRVMNQWISIQNKEEWDSPDAPEHYWYYFNKDGKRLTSKWQSIDGNWYYFNQDGHMATGKTEIDGATYYLGDGTDGIMKTGWIQLEEDSDNPTSDFSWYYFDNNGKMVVNQIDKKIDGHYYTFVDGKMQTEWHRVSDSDASSTSVEGYQYYEKETGKRASGWHQIEGAPGISEESVLHSFYFKNGKPYHAEQGLQLFTVDSKKYAFNTKGEMQTGKQVVTLEDDSVANFYFGTDGVMKTGKQVLYDEELGEDQTWFFYTDGSKKGQGFHGIRDNTLFEYGIRKEADADLRYAPMSFQENSYLVNTSGVIQKASNSSKSSSKPDLGNGFKDIKDSNEKIWTVDVDGAIQ